MSFAWVGLFSEQNPFSLLCIKAISQNFLFKSYFRKWMKDQISCQGSLKGLYQYKSVSKRLIYSLKACESSWRCNNSFFISVNFILPTMILWNLNLTFFNWLQTHSHTMKRIIFFNNFAVSQHFNLWVCTRAIFGIWRELNTFSKFLVSFLFKT